MGWIKRPHVLQILKIWTHKLRLCFPQIRRDGRWDNAPHGSVQVCVFIRLNARQHTRGLSGKGLFLVHQKRDRENTTRPPTSRHVSYSSHIWYLPHPLISVITSVSLCGHVEVCVPTAGFLIPSCMFALKKCQLFLSTCLYFMDSTMEFMGGNPYKSVWEIPWWLQNLYFFFAPEFMLTN